MNDYILMTDSSADLPDKLVRELNLEVLPLTFVLKGKNYKNWPDNREMAPKAFYRQLREGAVATTAAVNVADVVERVEPLLPQGKDVLLLSFSSGLSATCDSARIAAQELGEQYPERKYRTGSGSFLWWTPSAPLWGRACWCGTPPGGGNGETALRPFGTGWRKTSSICATGSPWTT